MGVSIGRTLQTAWTWDTFPGVWDDDASAAKPWDEAGVMQFSADITEATSITEDPSVRSVFGLYLDEVFGVTDSFVQALTMGILEPLTLSEGLQLNSNFAIRANETIVIGELLANTVSQALVEAFSVYDDLATIFTLAKDEQFLMAEAESRQVEYLRSWAEDLGLDDALANTATISNQEAAGFLDYLLRNANGIIADISVFKTAYGLAEFEAQAKAAPTGFTPFVPFLAGEHTFGEAIFKTTMESTSNLTRPRLASLVAAIDVPDVTEQGIVTVQVGGTHVTYTKNFFKVPSVKVTVKSGVALCQPRISNETTLGFDVKLESIANPGTFIAGVATWSSEGY